jgi:hypothetical protein
LSGIAAASVDGDISVGDGSGNTRDNSCGDAAGVVMGGVGRVADNPSAIVGARAPWGGDVTGAVVAVGSIRRWMMSVAGVAAGNVLPRSRADGDPSA